MGISEEINTLKDMGASQEMLDLYMVTAMDDANGVTEIDYEKEFERYLDLEYDGLNKKTDELLNSPELLNKISNYLECTK